MLYSLGAEHDGIDNTCSANDQHIMVAQAAQLTDANYKNAYTFSNCSIQEFKAFLTSLSLSSVYVYLRWILAVSYMYVYQDIHRLSATSFYM